MRSHNPIGQVSLQKGEIWTQLPTQGDCYVRMKGETGVMFLQARELQRSPANHQRRGEAESRFFPQGTQNQPTFPVS